MDSNFEFFYSKYVFHQTAHFIQKVSISQNPRWEYSMFSPRIVENLKATISWKSRIQEDCHLKTLTSRGKKSQKFPLCVTIFTATTAEWKEVRKKAPSVHFPPLSLSNTFFFQKETNAWQKRRENKRNFGTKKKYHTFFLVTPYLPFLNVASVVKIAKIWVK